MIVYIALGGLLGTLTRYGLQGWVQERIISTTLPAGTVVVNILGSFALGFIMRYTTGSMIVTPEVRAGLTVGFCGAFTTMSTFAYEGLVLMGDGEYGPATLYIGVTLTGCIIATAIGMILANRLL